MAITTKRSEQEFAASQQPPRIRQLPENVVNKIAAGEVIQRPCNAVKELVENSLDAGSTMIQISLREGGLKLIQVQDDGHGIQQADLPILCERFTTSKLKEFEDLAQLVTFGFRGEALASLSYVSRLSVTTRTKGQLIAYRAEYKDGKLMGSPKPCAGNPGTNIVAEDLFYNVPMRKGALKSAKEEYARVGEIIARYSLHYAGKCGFFLRSLDKKPGAASPMGSGGDLRTTANWSLKDVVRAVYGQRVAKDLLPVNSCESFDATASTRIAIERLGLRFNCLLTNPNKITSEGTPTVQLVLFVNNRLVECAAVKRSLEAAYATLLPHRAASLYTSSSTNQLALDSQSVGPKSSLSEYGNVGSRSALFVYLSIQLPTTSLDVNVHPTKAEVFFLHEDEIVTGLREAFEQALLSSSGSQNLLVQSLRLTQSDISASLPLKVTRLDSPSSSQITSFNRPKDMVRTDVRTQRLEAFLQSPSSTSIEQVTKNLNNRVRSLSPEVGSDSDDDDDDDDGGGGSSSVSMINKTKDPLLLSESAGISSSSIRPHTPMGSATPGRRPVLLTSLMELRDRVEKRACGDARGVLRECLYVGCLDASRCLVQQATNLLLMRLHPLARELFYQLMLVNFANHGEMVLSCPASLDTLLRLGVEIRFPNHSPTKAANIVERGLNILKKRSAMLWDYFSVKISTHESGQLMLHSLPILLERFTPDLRQLPVFVTSLVLEVDWNDEIACFEGICRIAGDFFAHRMSQEWVEEAVDDANAIGNMKYGEEEEEEDASKENRESPKDNYRRSKLPWEWCVEHVILPAIRIALLPPKDLCFSNKAPVKSEENISTADSAVFSPALLKLTSLPDLYKVFERC